VGRALPARARRRGGGRVRREGRRAQSEGLDIPRLIAYQKQETTVSGFPGSDPIGNEDLLLLPVDVLVPAALAASSPRPT